jgi:hypothetical protein
MNHKKIRERLDAMSTYPKRNLLWRPEPGKNTIRIVPHQYNDEGVTTLCFYYDLSDRPLISPISFGRPDPIVEFCQKLRLRNTEEDKAAADSLEPKVRFYVPVLVRGKEHEGIKFWGVGKQVMDAITDTCDDPDYGDITDPITGRDLTVEYDEKARGNRGSTTIRPKPNVTPISDDRKVIEMLKEDQFKIESLWKEPTYDELKDILKDYLTKSKEKAAAAPAPPPPAPTPPTSTASTVVGGGLDDLPFNTPAAEGDDFLSELKAIGQPGAGTVNPPTVDVKAQFEKMFNGND